MEQFIDITLQCTCDASFVLSMKCFLMFEKSAQSIVYHQVEYNSDLHVRVISKYHPIAPVQNCYSESPNEYFHVVCVKFHVRMNRNCLIP